VAAAAALGGAGRERAAVALATQAALAALPEDHLLRLPTPVAAAVLAALQHNYPRFAASRAAEQALEITAQALVHRTLSGPAPGGSKQKLSLDEYIEHARVALTVAHERRHKQATRAGNNSSSNNNSNNRAGNNSRGVGSKASGAGRQEEEDSTEDVAELQRLMQRVLELIRENTKSGEVNFSPYTALSSRCFLNVTWMLVP
jgi:hypothetical protein